MSAPLGLGTIYAQVARTYAAWSRSLLTLALIVFVPIGLLSAIPLSVEIDSLQLGTGLLATGVVLAALALAGTSLLGEVFFSGVVAVSLTYEDADRRPTIREIAGRLAYRRLIAVDLIYGLLFVVGFFLLVVPGIAAYVFFALAGPVVEIERRGVRAAFARSAYLVRGHFWLVLGVLGPLEIVGEGLGALADLLAQALLGHNLWADWLAETLSNVVFTPFLAVACVLLTVTLIAEKEGAGPRLHSHPPNR